MTRKAVGTKEPQIAIDVQALSLSTWEEGMRVVHLAVMVVGGHWTLKVHDGAKFHIAGSSLDRETFVALAHRMSADWIARGDQPIVTVDREETIAA